MSKPYAPLHDATFRCLMAGVIEGARGEVAAIRSFDVYPPAATGVRHQKARVYIPKNIGAGTAVLRSTIRFRCNWFQDIWPITVYAPPVEIAVVEPAIPG